jgi:hypothetical protein
LCNAFLWRCKINAESLNSRAEQVIAVIASDAKISFEPSFSRDQPMRVNTCELTNEGDDFSD